MKNLFLSILLLSVFNISSGQSKTLSKPIDYSSSAVSENPYSTEWDWEAGDILLDGIPHYWMYFQNKPNAIQEYATIAPWYQYGAWAGLVDRKKADGWVLLSRNFGTPTRRIDNLENPYFVLLNTHKSVIRVFILLKNMKSTYEYSTMNIKKYENGAQGTGVLSHLSSISYAMDKIHKSYNNSSSSVINTLAMESRWVYADYPLGYDANLLPVSTTEIPASLEFRVFGTEVKNILLETKGFSAQGDKNFIDAYMKKNNFDSPSLSLNADNMPELGVNFTLPGVDIKSTAPNWNSVKQYFEGVQIDLGFGNIDVSNPFGGFAEGLSGALSALSLASPIGISGLDLGGLFKFFVGGGMSPGNTQQTAPTFISSQYSSKGTMTSKVPYAVLTIPLPAARINYNSPMLGNPIGLVRNDPVGIFTLLKTPRVYKKTIMRVLENAAPENMYAFYQEYEVSDNLDFKINPAANLNLVNMDVSLVDEYSRDAENESWLFERINSTNQKYLIRFDVPAGRNKAIIKSMTVPHKYFKGRKLYQTNQLTSTIKIRVKAVFQRKDNPSAQPVVFLSMYDVDVVDQGVFNQNYTITPMPTIPPQNVKCIIPASGGVRISWDRNLENNIASYFVERSINGGSYIVIGSTKDTLVVDNEVQKSVKPYLSNRQNVAVNYRVRAKSEWIDDDSTKKCQYSDYSDVVSISGSIIASFGKFGLEQVTPGSHSLSPNFPNPFNPSTTIYYGIKENTEVSIKVFNALGQEVATLVSGPKEVGYHYAEWNAAGMPSGMYFYRIQAGDFTETKKMTLMK